MFEWTSILILYYPHPIPIIMLDFLAVTARCRQNTKNGKGVHSNRVD